ncbi:unnamed protein product [Discula destructiva]
MSLVVPWPAGDNATDTIIDGSHFNLSTLEFWNYTLYSNDTLSNGTWGWCMLFFQPHTPDYVFPNGSFTNQTSCYSPINNIGTRGYISIALCVVYGLALVLTLMNLAKHGRMYLPTEKRFRPVGRRWQWYWMIMMCATAVVSLITNIDVDRYYISQIPIIITAFFWMLMNLCTMACVWEAVRHWGSWMERQYIDPDPFALAMDDKRAQFEFFVPLVFYLFWWLDFFMVVPRNWGNIQLQRNEWQIANMAAPSATDARFKAGAFMLFVSWLITVYHLRHSIKHYRERNRGLINRAVGLIKFTPYRFQLMVPIALFVVAFQALSAWVFEYSVFAIQGNLISEFVGGYGPSILILLVQVIAGLVNPNEDKELIRQRRIRGAAADRELGIKHKPAWWRRRENETMRERIERNVREVGGGRATATNIEGMIANRLATGDDAAANNNNNINNNSVEMGEMSSSSRAAAAAPSASGARPAITPVTGRSDRIRSDRTMQQVAGLLFPGAETTGMTPERLAERTSFLTESGPPPPPYSGGSQRGRPRTNESSSAAGATMRPSSAQRSGSANTTNSIGAPPQQIKSMLDV